MPNDSINHARIVSLIWGIADDVLRDVYVRSKYRDVILPLTVLRRLDSVLESTRDAVKQMKETLDGAGIANQDGPLRQSAGQDFYNHSGFTFKDLRKHRERNTAAAELRGLPRRLLTERPGDHRQFRVPQPTPATDQGLTRWAR